VSDNAVGTSNSEIDAPTSVVVAVDAPQVPSRNWDAFDDLIGSQVTSQTQPIEAIPASSEPIAEPNVVIEEDAGPVLASRNDVGCFVAEVADLAELPATPQLMKVTWSRQVIA